MNMITIALSHLSMIGSNDPPVIGVPVLPLLKLVHEEQILFGARSVVTGILGIPASIPAKQKI